MAARSISSLRAALDEQLVKPEVLGSLELIDTHQGDALRQLVHCSKQLLEEKSEKHELSSQGKRRARRSKLREPRKWYQGLASFVLSCQTA